MKKRVIFIVVSILLIALLLIPTACVPKKSDSTTSVDSTSDSARIAALESKLSQLQSKVANVQNPQNYDSQIANLQSELSAVKSSVQIQLDSFQPDMPDIPKYALVTDIGRRSVGVTVYGTGDFPVVVTLYGAGLETGVIEAEDSDYDVEAEFLYGQTLSSSSSIQSITLSGGTYETEMIPSDPAPNAHEHEVTIPDAEVDISLPTATLSNIGTMLVIIVEPDDPWTNGYTFELDIRDVGDIYYATASVAYAD